MTASQLGTTLLTKRSSRVVAAQKLHRRRVRDQRGEFLVEGPQAIAEAISLDASLSEIFVTEQAKSRYQDMLATARSGGVRISCVEDTALAALADTVHPQGMISVCRYLDVVEPQTMQLCVVLDGVSDPGNAGTILRTADAAGAQAVYFPDDTVDPYNGKCVRSSVGSLFHVPAIRGGKTRARLQQLRDAGMRVIAADAHGDSDLDSVIDANVLSQPTAWLFGGEAHGLPHDLAAEADLRVRVPIYGKAESLNLATAAAVCLYASARQFRKGDTAPCATVR